MVASVLGFGVLGPLQMSVNGIPVSLGTPKQRAVLAMLVINRNRPVSIDSLISAAWERRPPPAARASLHSYVSNLRKLLTSAGVGSGTSLVSAPPGYRLSVAENACDVGRFIIEKTAGVRAAAAGHFEEASRHLAAALAEWRGPVLEDLSDFEFVYPIAAALLEDKVLAHTARAEAEIACGRGYAVIGELEALIAEHPYREPLWAQLITAYYLAERQSEALNAYRRLKKALADDLGIDPGPTIQALHERILRQEPLDVRKAAKNTAVDTVVTIDQRTTAGVHSALAGLRDATGHTYPLRGTVTRIGRLPDNDIVLEDPKVSRHHAVIIDTGASFVITDLGSANGVVVGQHHIRGSVALAHGDHIHICDHQFTFEIQSNESLASSSHRRCQRRSLAT
ncbi:putative transcriptional regulatory protein EmbR [Mycobacterium tuberculosis H37Rv] [Mycobacterium shimoidei]|uniref:Putative transcriptional regulatory protein EmbR [Mycobacterium tuberculosis H37Rv] n=1 Tax=Mycobacterium shimoidei TaxID=29313 RepID=A0A375YU79_MYCSH|nr:BTAD domain-containing putative transcriptional regulator [Mycobacterium shimoidei]SRX92335.1 putative transcriptional regulatory protein EmbR [Mycobacterium tuberculosis H37Rv] [Mycobacterium shimoidei]